MENAGQGKQVFRQLKHEGKMKKRLDEDPLQSILKLLSKYQEDYPDKIIPGCIRHFSIEPLVIGIWSCKGVEKLHKRVINLPRIQVTTASLVTKNQLDKEIHYYGYTLDDSVVKIELIPFLEILTNCLDGRPLTTCLEGFKKMKKLYMAIIICLFQQFQSVTFRGPQYNRYCKALIWKLFLLIFSPQIIS